MFSVLSWLKLPSFLWIFYVYTCGVWGTGMVSAKETLLGVGNAGLSQICCLCMWRVSTYLLLLDREAYEWSWHKHPGGFRKGTIAHNLYASIQVGLEKELLLTTFMQASIRLLLDKGTGLINSIRDRKLTCLDSSFFMMSSDYLNCSRTSEVCIKH